MNESNTEKILSNLNEKQPLKEESEIILGKVNFSTL